MSDEYEAQNSDSGPSSLSERFSTVSFITKEYTITIYFPTIYFYMVADLPFIAESIMFVSVEATKH
jgi:hypothetical protein